MSSSPRRLPASLLLSASAALLLAACGTTGNSITRMDYPVRTAAAPSTAAAPTPAPVTGAPHAPRTGTFKVGRPYEVRGRWYTPAEDPDYDETGIASWYGDYFHGRPTASGEPFDMNAISAAHKTLPLQSIVEVTNLENGRTLQMRVNDRGPFVDGRIIDLSRAAAEELGVLRAGVARVRVRFVGAAPGSLTTQMASAATSPAGNTFARVDTSRQPATPQSGRFEVQAGTFSQMANAERAAEQLAGAGVPEIRTTVVNGATLYRVMVVGLSSERDAAQARERVVAAGFRDARVVRV